MLLTPSSQADGRGVDADTGGDARAERRGAGGVHERLRSVDANLLPVLLALLQERNLGRAAERLLLSPPATGNALGRLRRHFDDELLTRVGRGFELTPAAEALLPRVERAVQAVDALLGDRRGFSTQTSTKQFTVAMSEYAMTVLAEPLARRIREHAPACSVAVDPLVMSREQFESQLVRRDLVVGPIGFDFPGRTQPVFTDEVVCLVARDNPWLRDGALSLEDLHAMPHAVAGLPADGERRRPLTFDRELDRLGIADRCVLVRTTSVLTLPFAVSGTDLCAFVPSRLARRCLEILDLVVARTPIAPIRIVEVAHWHSRREADPAVVWLRRLLHTVAVEVAMEGVDG